MGGARCARQNIRLGNWLFLVVVVVAAVIEMDIIHSVGVQVLVVMLRVVYRK